MEIKQKYIPTSNSKTRPGLVMTPKYITIHETDNPNKGADAEAHARLQYNGNSRSASWHFTVDDHEIWQSLPTNEVGWHSGDGYNGTGNRFSIGIEICVNQDGDFAKAKANAAWLVKYLMKKHNIPLSNVVQHNKWSGKNCPRNIRAAGWTNFLKQIENQSEVPTIAERRVLKLTSPYMSGDDVKQVQAKLGVTADGIFGPKTKDTVVAFQKAKGLTADGIVGKDTYDALFPPPSPPDMHDLSYVINGELKGVISSTNPSKISPEMERLMKAKANCVLLVKRGYDLRHLYNILHELYKS